MVAGRRSKPDRRGAGGDGQMSRLVLDTNVLVSALVFRDSRHQPLREAWQAGTLARSCRWNL